MRRRLTRILCSGLVLCGLPLLLSACGSSEPVPAKPSADAVSKPQPKPAVAPAKTTPDSPKPAPAPTPPAPPKPVAAAPKPAPAKEPEHIPNAGFETANDKEGAAAWWSDDPKTVRDKKSNSGAYAMKIHPGTKKGEIRRLSTSIRNGKTLLGKHITIKAKTMVKMRPKADAKAPAPFAMHVQYTVKGKEQEFYHLHGGGNEWQDAMVAGTIPADADPDSLRLVIAVRGSAADPVLVDDVELSVK